MMYHFSHSKSLPVVECGKSKSRRYFSSDLQKVTCPVCHKLALEKQAQCQGRATVHAGSALRRATVQCSRAAKYTDGRYFFCTQHAKEIPTTTRKATGKIRADMTPLANNSTKTEVKP